MVGKSDWFRGQDLEFPEAVEDLERLHERGFTTVGVVVDGLLIGVIGIGDELKADAADTVERMSEADISPVMVTSDNERTARSVADAVGIDRLMADVLPDEKRVEIGRVQDQVRRGAMVGDGVDDAPALSQADIGIAIGAGTDIPIKSADIVLMGDRLLGMMDAYEMGTVNYRKTVQNLVGAFSFNGLAVSAAVTGLIHPVFAMIAMVLSVTAVLANSFAGQLFSGEGIKTDFSVETEDINESVESVSAL